MKDINIDGKVQRVFVLTETEKRVVYIPLKDLHRVDYERLVEFDKEEGELMKVMARSTLDNGMNALTQYEKLFQIADINDGKGTRVRKPEEGVQNKPGALPQDPNALMLSILEKLTNIVENPPVVQVTNETKAKQTRQAAKKPAPKKPAPAPKTDE